MTAAEMIGLAERLEKNSKVKGLSFEMKVDMRTAAKLARSWVKLMEYGADSFRVRQAIEAVKP